MSETVIRICVPTDDGLQVKIGHFGDAKYYFHYIVKNNKIILEKIVENPYRGEHEHNEEGEEEKGKRRKIYEMNRDCNFIVATFFGPGGSEYMEKRGLKIIQVKPKTSIKEAIEKVLSG